MDRIYVFILRNDVWILILATLALIWYISEIIRSRRMLKRAVFTLERERGSQIRNNAAIFILVLSSIITLILYVNFQVAPTLPPELLRDPPPTPDPIRPQLASPTPLAPTFPSPTPPLAPTITLGSQPGPPPVSEVITGETSLDDGSTDPSLGPTVPAAPPTPVIGCNLQLVIAEPRNGAVVTGLIEFFGTANTANFGGYLLEANGPQTNGQWASLLGRTIDQRVSDSLLGNVNLTEWESGPYLIRLTAVDENDFPAYQCVIQITLETG